MRIAMISAHTSPLEQPGVADAGGMNVYLIHLARALSNQGAQVEIFTRRTSSQQADHIELDNSLWVHHIDAGPYEGLEKNELPAQMCYFTAGMLRYEATRRQHWFDVVHSHYWLSAMAGWLAADRWSVPLVHTMHTVAKAKNRHLSPADQPEPEMRVVGESQAVAEADFLVASTLGESHDLQTLYGANPSRIAVIPPGVATDLFTPLVDHDRRYQQKKLRAELKLDPDRPLVVFAGRLQPLKGPDVLVHAWARWRTLFDEGLIDIPPAQLAIFGGSSGATNHRAALTRLVADLGLQRDVTLRDAIAHDELARVYHAADIVTIPSYYETFGLVGLEAQACGTPVVAANVGGLATVVRNQVTGALVAGHEPQDWANTIAGLLSKPEKLTQMGRAAYNHAQQFSWQVAARQMLQVYRQAGHQTMRGNRMAG